MEFDTDGRLSVASMASVRRAAEAGHTGAGGILGAALCQAGRYAEGIPWLEGAWAAGDVDAGFNLGTFAKLQGDLNRAEAIWRKVADTAASGSADAMLGLARLALERGDRGEAARWIEPVLGQDDGYPVTALGVAFRDDGDQSTALRLFHAAIGRGDPYAMEYAARIYDARGAAEHAAELRGRAADVRTVEANRQSPVLGL